MKCDDMESQRFMGLIYGGDAEYLLRLPCHVGDWRYNAARANSSIYLWKSRNPTSYYCTKRKCDLHLIHTCRLHAPFVQPRIQTPISPFIQKNPSSSTIHPAIARTTFYAACTTPVQDTAAMSKGQQKRNHWWSLRGSNSRPWRY